MRLRFLATRSWGLCWTGQWSRLWFCWIPLNLVIALPFGVRWMPTHSPCGFSFKRDQAMSSTGLTVNCAVAVLANAQF
jgi:hypothetical protein